MLFNFSSSSQNKKGSFIPRGIKKKEHSTTLFLDENNPKLLFLNAQVGVITRTKANSLGTLGNMTYRLGLSSRSKVESVEYKMIKILFTHRTVGAKDTFKKDCG